MSVTDSQALSNYNEAFKLLKENPPEQRLDIQLPYAKFLQLDNAFLELKSEAGISEDQRYPSLAYNRVTQTVTVVTAPGNIHERAARWIDIETSKFVDDYLSTRSPHTLRHIGPVGSTTMGFSYGGYEGSRKEADGGFTYESLDVAKMVIAVEVGYTEAYGKLLDDKDMSIIGRGVNVVVLIGERKSSNVTCRSRNCPIERPTRLLWSAKVQGSRGWAGELTEAFIEVWRKDELHDRMTAYFQYLIREGVALAVDCLPDTLGIRIRDFYPSDVWEQESVSIEDRTQR